MFQRIASTLIVLTALVSAAPDAAANSRPLQMPSAGACTQFFLHWRKNFSFENDEAMNACTAFMGIDKKCADQDSSIVVGYVDAPGTWEGQTRTLKCSPNFHTLTIGEQFVRIGEGVVEGLITAAPFIGEGVLGLSCIYGQIYACVVLSIEISDQAGLRIPTEVGDAIYIAAKAPQCVDGDVVACAYLGARGAKAVGLEIPGVPVAEIIDNSNKCSGGDFAACARLGKAAADAGGIDVGALSEGILDSQACLDGNKDTCVKLAKEAIKDQVPIDSIDGARKSAEACKAGDTDECERAGKKLAAAVAGLSVDFQISAPFGANACTSVPSTRGAVGLASAWNDRGNTSIAAFASDGTRFRSPFRASARDGGWAETAKWAAADFNGDGYTDMLAAWDDGGNNTLTLRQANDDGFTVAHWAIRAGTWSDTAVWLPGDFNGDGRMDIAGAWNDQGQTSIAVFLSDGTKFKAPIQWSQRDGGWGDGVKWAVGDFTGDGKADIAAIWNNGGSNTLTIRQSTGSGFAPVHWASNAGGWNEESVWLAGDFNGDGRLDLAGVWHDGNAVSIAVYPSNGSQFQGWTQWSQRHGSWIGDAKWTAGDFNGDGKTDIASTWNEGGSNTITVRQSTGSSFVDAHWARSSGGWSPSAAWCVGHFPDGFSSTVAYENPESASVTAVRQPSTVKPQARVRLDGASATTLPPTTMSTCGFAYAAAVRNSPAAPGLKQSCLARGGSFVLDPPLPREQLDALALKGGPIADADPELSALRAQQTGDAGKRGFNIGVAAADKQTLPGPGKQHTYNSLARDEQPGYDAAVSFVLERNRR